MTHDTPTTPGRWDLGDPPHNVAIGANSLVTGDLAFKRFHSRRASGLTLGAHCTMEGVHFNVGAEGAIAIGDYCYFTNVVLLCEMEITIGSYVMIGWNTTITDTDFHPVAPAERIADAISQSPLGKGRPRPEIAKRPIVIGDDVWIGPAATILKGVTIGRGAWIEPGALVTRDVPAGARVLGNPARTLAEDER
jgi:acetyltransferase-like isoleucine patch superfamily enzyme